ncbi:MULTISPECIES: DUF4232 domain-containing protein [unclassified Streptomyces]|uniref:DUF4232 domain-containing protein n=1 Tax=unclassified Streptomyces TaxID=2593676 RepID=UPI00093C204F|nr:DUF4232 domain-containing protein [Streptomyces sp. CB02400]OKK11047.1 hypothetical protein AMK33_13135 [Streptomyces sp. CB02400]
MRTSRIRLVAATGAVLAALALTACEDGTGTQDEGASQPAGAAESVGTTPSGGSQTDKGQSTGGGTAEQDKAGDKSGGKTGDKGTSANTGGGSGGSDDPGVTRLSCNGSNTTVDARPVSRPVNHMLITVKNSGSQNCNLTYYPVLRFDEMQWVPQPVEASKPQAVVTLAPGETAYAGVLLSAADGSGDGGATAHKLTVAFQGNTPNSDGGPSAVPALPADGVYYDSSMAVTYWQQSMDDALTY